METFRLPLFIIAVVLVALVVCVELGSAGFMDSADKDSVKLAGDFGATPPGYGIGAMALLDGMLLFTVGLMGLSMILKKGIHAKLQGCATLIVSFLLVLGAIVLILLWFMLLMLMVTLLLGAIFGTIAYMAMYSHFDTGKAQIVLSLLMFLKLGFAVCLVLSHQRFLQNKGLVLLVLTSLLLQIITSFLHSFPPGFLVSITDVIAALISAIVAVIWGVIFLVGSIISVVKALRVDRDLA